MSYAVVWSEGAGPVHAGRLDLSDEGVLLAGTALPRRGISYRELAAVTVERRRRERLSGRPTVVLERRDGAPVRVASLDGAGTLHELAERLAAVVTGAAACAPGRPGAPG